MNFRNYCEQYTLGEMTFGMEIEGVVEDGYTKDALLDQFKELVHPMFIPDANMKDDPSIDGERCDHCDGDGYINIEGDDEDGTETCSYCGGTGQLFETFEFVTPPMPCTPKNISLMMHFFSSCFKNHLFTTNKSCGLHVHIGLPDSFNSAEDRFWIMCQIADDPELLKFIGMMETNRGNFDFINLHYASDGAFKKIGYALQNQQITKLSDLFNSDKFRLMRIHPKYNTLEWRGPRNFLNSGNISLVKQFFFEKLLPLVKVFTKLQIKDTITWGDGTISRKEFFDLVKTSDDELRYAASVRKREAKNDKRWHKSQDPKEIAKLLAVYPEFKQASFKDAEMQAYVGNDGKIVIMKGKFSSQKFDKRFVFDGNVSLVKCYFENVELTTVGHSICIDNHFVNCKIISYGDIDRSVFDDCSIRFASLNECRCNGCSFDEVRFDNQTKTEHSKKFESCVKVANRTQTVVTSDNDVNNNNSPK